MMAGCPMHKKTVMESGTVVMVSTPGTAQKLAAESSRLARRGIASIVFPSQQMADDWMRRLAALTAKRRELAQAA